MRTIPWLVGASMAGNAGVLAARMIAAGRFDLASACGTAAYCAATIALAWLVLRRASSKIDRELREAAEARRLLADEE